MKRTMVTFATIFYAILLMLSFSNAAEISEIFEKTYDLRFGGEIVLENVNGAISIESWDKGSVHLEAVKKVRASSKRDAETFMDRVKIRVSLHYNRISIKTEYPQRRRDSGFLAWMFGNRMPEVTVEYTLMVPQKSDLSLRTVNGSISVSDVEGKLELITTNGQVEVEQIQGSVEAKTLNGSITVELTEFASDDELRLKTINGSIVTYLPNDVDAELDAHTVNGLIRSDFPLKVHGKWGNKHSSGTLGRGRAHIKLETINGSIKIFERRKN